MIRFTAQMAEKVRGHPMVTHRRKPNLRLQEARALKGWSQEELAAQLGTTFETVSRWERGLMLPGPFFRTRLCAMFGMTAEALGLLSEAETPLHSSLSSTQVVVAWAAQDKEYEVVGHVLTALQAQGILTVSPWVLGRQGPAHKQERLDEAIRAAQLVLLILSPHAPASRDVRTTLHLAQLYGRPLAALWIAGDQQQECLPPNVPSLLSLIDARTADTESIVQGVFDLVEQTAPAEHAQRQSSEDHERSSSDVQSLSLWNVPYPRNPFFTGREDLLDRLVTSLRPGQAAALSQPVAINGLGGIGKTHVAVEYAYRHRQDYQHVFWVRADRRENLASDFVAMARELHLPTVDTQQSVHAMQAWLRTHDDWLLILDNADDLALAREFLPSYYGGKVLLTTRAQAMGRLAQRIEVDTMPEGVGVLFLLRRTGLIMPSTSLELVKPQERELARELARELGGLPLALDQAGAYIEETPCGIEEYLRLFRTQRSALLSRRGGIVDDHPTSVATTWSLAFASVEQANPAAADLLNVCAFLHPDAIPEDLLRQGATQMEAPLQGLGTSDLVFHEALRTLGAYSLLRRDLSSRTLSIHRLVQAVLIDAMTPETIRAWVERTTRLVLTALPDSFATGWAVWEHLLPHVLTCAEHILQAKMISSEATHFLGLAGNYLREHGHFTEAETLYLQAQAIYEQELGPTHPATVAFLNDLGRVYRDKGEYAEAERPLKRTLAIREQELGPMHPETAISLEDLGQIYQAQGKYAEAETLYQRTLAIREQELGPMHLATAGIFCNLGGLYQAQGKYAEAETFYLQAQAICEQELGPRHSTTAMIFGSLGNLYQAQGKYVEAEALYLRALAIDEQERGPMHPATAWMLINLGVLYQAQGRLTEAEEALQRSLTIWEKLQDTKKYMAMVLYHLGNVYQAQGKLKEAKEVLQQALMVCEQQVRPNVEQPYTQMIRENYEALLKHLAGSAEVSGDNTPGESHQRK